MKRMLFIASIALFFAACNSSASKTEETAKTETTAPPAETIDYAYLPANHPPDNWDRGDQKNIAMVLKSLKAWENGNVEESASYFADSVELGFDGFEKKVSHDTLLAMIKDLRKNISSVSIRMQDYESVISKDKKEEWVSLWYKEITTDNKGKTDSVFYMDDLKISNGKITVLDQKSRRYSTAKK